jgi:hypothetical protein
LTSVDLEKRSRETFGHSWVNFEREAADHPSIAVSVLKQAREGKTWFRLTFVLEKKRRRDIWRQWCVLERRRGRNISCVECIFGREERIGKTWDIPSKVLRMSSVDMVIGKEDLKVLEEDKGPSTSGTLFPVFEKKGQNMGS